MRKEGEPGNEATLSYSQYYAQALKCATIIIIQSLKHKIKDYYTLLLMEGITFAYATILGGILVQPGQIIIEAHVRHSQSRIAGKILPQHHFVARIIGPRQRQYVLVVIPVLLSKISDRLSRQDLFRAAVRTVVAKFASAAVVAGKVPVALAHSRVVVRPVNTNVARVIVVPSEVDRNARSAVSVSSTNSVISGRTAHHVLETVHVRTCRRNLSKCDLRQTTQR